jgi:hypothetical protein
MATTKIRSSSILDGQVDNADLSATVAVTGGQIADGAITIAKLAATGAASAGTYLQGDNTWGAIAASGFNSVIVYTGSATWTKSARPAGITKVIVEVQGGGGGGARQFTASYVCGGSGGGYAKKFIDVSSVTASVISVGLGGAGAVGPADASGVSGGDSSWIDTASGGSSTVTGVKGVGGIHTPAWSTSLGGAATGGDINIAGQNGDTDAWGKSGDSQLGRGGRNVFSGQLLTAPSTGYGAGGAGGRQMSALNGRDGVVIVWEYK